MARVRNWSGIGQECLIAQSDATGSSSTGQGRASQAGCPTQAYRHLDPLRRVGIALGVDRDLRAQLLSHGRTYGIQQRHYERHDFLPEKTAALALLEDHIVRIVGGEPAQIEGRDSGRAKRVASNDTNSTSGAIVHSLKTKDRTAQRGT